ncbi:hypothetical protein ACFLVD_00310 [Chloroflexota bacterium]
MEKPKIPLSQIVFGDFIYWLSIVAALMCIIGPVIGMLSVSDNVLNPHHLFATIWEGKNAEAVWQEVGGEFPGGHFWLHNLTGGDGFTQLGLVIGCASALPALLAAAVVYLWKKPRAYVFAFLALWIVALILISLLGIVEV